MNLIWCSVVLCLQAGFPLGQLNTEHQISPERLHLQLQLNDMYQNLRGRLADREDVTDEEIQNLRLMLEGVFTEMEQEEEEGRDVVDEGSSVFAQASEDPPAATP